MKIERLEPSRHVKGRFLVHMENGDLIKVTEQEVVTFALAVGAELTSEKLDALREAGKQSSAKARAASMVGARPLSRKELTRRLEEKGEDPEHARQAVDWLEELGAVNDADYGRTVARHYSAKGYGPRKIQEELYRRGVPKELWEQAMEEAVSPEEGIDAYLSRKLRGEDLEDPKAIKRAADGLMRRGYRWEDIKAGLRRCGAEV
jgi:regulatory protein